LFFLKALLNNFETASGLRVNYNKSQILPINVSHDRMQHLANTFGCQVGSLPFTYLGLLMGTTKPCIEDLTPIMDRVERRLPACSMWLSYSGRLQMVNSAITPIVTYTLCTIKVPKGFIDNVDRKGGLNVINLRLQNDALLLKQLHKFYNKVDVP